MRYLSVCSGIEAASCAWQPGRDAMSDAFEVGQTVVLRHDIIDPADDCHPALLCGKAGDEVVIRYAATFGGFDWYVSHAHRTDAAFAVKNEEIERPTTSPERSE